MGRTKAGARMAELKQPVNQDDHHRGDLKSPVTLVEYGDFECEHCGNAYPVVGRLIEQIGDHLCFVYRHFPLKQSHPHAQQAAEAAEAAAAQGRFWQMHDLLFKNQEDLGMNRLVEMAQQIGLDVQRFKSELESGAYSSKVRDDFMSGVRSGVNGTPTFFINGARYDGPVILEAMMEEILARIS